MLCSVALGCPTQGNNKTPYTGKATNTSYQGLFILSGSVVIGQDEG